MNNINPLIYGYIYLLEVLEGKLTKLAKLLV